MRDRAGWPRPCRSMLSLHAGRRAMRQPLPSNAQPWVGGMEVQRLAVATQLGQGWELIDPRQDREHVQQVRDRVGGQIGEPTLFAGKPPLRNLRFGRSRDQNRQTSNRTQLHESPGRQATLHY